MITEKISKIQEAIEKYGFKAQVNGDQIQIRNRKNQLAAIVTENGCEQKYVGQKNLCGSLVRNDINAIVRNN